MECGGKRRRRAAQDAVRFRRLDLRSDRHGNA